MISKIEKNRSIIIEGKGGGGGWGGADLVWKFAKILWRQKFFLHWGMNLDGRS